VKLPAGVGLALNHFADDGRIVAGGVPPDSSRR
jgi:hypothetical protein